MKSMVHNALTLSPSKNDFRSSFSKHHAVRHCHPNECNQPVTEIVVTLFRNYYRQNKIATSDFKRSLDLRIRPWPA